MAKYDPLNRYLRRQTVETLELSFREIENLLKAMLPRSSEHPTWWAHDVVNPDHPPHQLSWLNAGYEARLMDGRERVHFRRRQRPPTPAPAPVPGA